MMDASKRNRYRERILSSVKEDENGCYLAQAFGVTQSNISMIGKKQTWRHVP